MLRRTVVAIEDRRSLAVGDEEVDIAVPIGVEADDAASLEPVVDAGGR